MRHAPIIAILLLAGFLRLYLLPSLPPGLYHDEAMNGCNALEVLETGKVKPFYPENAGREGLYVNAAAISIALFGNTAWALRLPAVFFGMLTIAGLFLLTRRLFSEPVALFAAFFLATSFWHIIFSREALRAIAAPCLLTWALYLFTSGRMLAAGIVYGLGFYTYLAYRATPLVLALLWRGARGRMRFLVAALAVAVPLAVYFIAHPGTFAGRAGQISVFAAQHPAREIALNVWRTARMFFTRGDANWRHNIAWRAELFAPVAILFVAGAILSRRKTALPLVWLGVGALPAVFSNEGVPHALRAILMLPPACMLAGVGAWEVARRVPRVAVVVLLAGFACQSYYAYFIDWGRNPNVARAFEADAAAIAAQINSMPDEIPKYVVAPAPGAPITWPVMFLTHTCTARERAARNVEYVTQAPPKGRVFFLDATPR